MSTQMDSRISCTTETRKLVQAQKRGGESYDSVLRKMVEQYDPEEAPPGPVTPEREESESGTEDRPTAGGVQTVGGAE